jgi:hypothetical protein
MVLLTHTLVALGGAALYGDLGHAVPVGVGAAPVCDLSGNWTTGWAHVTTPAAPAQLRQHYSRKRWS